MKKYVDQLYRWPHAYFVGLAIGAGVAICSYFAFVSDVSKYLNSTGIIITFTTIPFMIAGCFSSERMGAIVADYEPGRSERLIRRLSLIMYVVATAAAWTLCKNQ